MQVGTIENTPDKTQTTSEAFTDPVFSNTPVGDMNMPDPMMLPTMTVTPFKRLILGFSSIPSSSAGATSASTADPSSFRFTPIFVLDYSFLTQLLRSTTARGSIYPRVSDLKRTRFNNSDEVGTCNDVYVDNYFNKQILSYLSPENVNMSTNLNR